MPYFFDPLRRECKSLTGAIPRGSTVTLRIFHSVGGECEFSARVCALLLREDGGETEEILMKRTEYGFSVTLVFHETGLFFYRFRLDDFYFGCGRGRRGDFSDNLPEWQITVFDESFRTPDWMKGGVMYQIFPDRFAKSGEIECAGRRLRSDWGGMPEYMPDKFGKVPNNDFFGGNFNGIREMLGYLEELHVSVMYFNPIFESASNHRYDTGDYMKPDPLLGTEEDFSALVKDAKKRGMHVVLDGVFNHTGDDSRYFNKYGRYKEELGAHQSPDSPYFPWYRFTRFPDKYESWWGVDILPAVNETDESYQQFIMGENGVLAHWMALGADGWRIDVADELPDFFLEKLRNSVKSENPDAAIIGEVWEDASNKIAYDVRRKYFLGKELDSVMNYPLKDAILNFLLTGSCEMLRETMKQLQDNYPKDVLDCLMNVLGTHDTPRVLTVLGGKPLADKDEMAKTRLTEQERTLAEKRQKMAATLQYTLPGIPCVYYGDEIGMEGYGDPFCRGCFDRTKTENETAKFYKKLGKIRSELHDILKDGEYREIFAGGSCFVFERRAKRSAYIYANNSTNRYTVRLNGKYSEHLTGETVSETLEIDGFCYGILTEV